MASKTPKSTKTLATSSVLARAVNGISGLLRGADSAPEPSGEKDAAWYNERFENTPEYQVHYTESSYYFLWTVVVDRIRRFGAKRILDLGCGPGQFASMLYDNGIAAYRGLDLSSTSIRMARARCPSFEFQEADLRHPDAMRGYDYDCLVTMEFLEHVPFDLEVLERIKSGARVIATVPNFPYVSHVRHFRDADEVRSRYQRHFSSFTVDAFLENQQGKTFFLMEGTKS